MLNSIVTLIGALLVTGGVIWLCLKLSRTFAAGTVGFGGGRHIRILDRAAFGPDKMLAIVSMAGNVYLLGVTSQSITVLEKLSSEDAALIEEQGEQTAVPSSFSTILKQFHNKK